MYKSGLSSVKPDLQPDPEAIVPPEQKVPNTMKLRRMMHLAKKAELYEGMGPKRVYGEDDDEGRDLEV